MIGCMIAHKAASPERRRRHREECMALARITGRVAVTAALAVVLTMGANAQNKPTLGGKLELADEGSFFVNAKSLKSDYPGASAATGPAAPGNIIVNQMYVH